MPTGAILLLVLLPSLAAYEAFGEFKLLPRERPTATRRLARNAFQGSLGPVTSHDCRFWEAQWLLCFSFEWPRADMACQSTGSICWLTMSVSLCSVYALHFQLKRYYSVDGRSLRLRNRHRESPRARAAWFASFPDKFAHPW